MNEPLTAACVQVEPVLFDRAATIERIAELAAEASGNGARLILFPEAFIPAYPSNRWVQFLSAGSGGKPVYAKLARESLAVPGPDTERLGQIAREHGLWLAVGANERQRRTIYNALPGFGPDGKVLLHHRELA